MIEASVKLESRIPQVTRELRPKISQATKRAAEEIATLARDRVPTNTGKLRDSIRVEFQGDGDWVVHAGDRDAFYAWMVEFGTTQAPAHPYMIPSAEMVRPHLDQLVKRALMSL